MSRSTPLRTRPVPPRGLVASLLFSVLACSAIGCNTGSVRHPLLGRIKPARAETAYWIYVDDGWLHLRVTPGDRGHRFQGSVTAIKGSLGALALERAGLAEQVAAQGDSIQFDLEPARFGEEGFRVRLDGNAANKASACVRFDLYVDGAHKPERVHLGTRRLSPKGIPFERCP